MKLKNKIEYDPRSYAGHYTVLIGSEAEDIKENMLGRGYAIEIRATNIYNKDDKLMLSLFDERNDKNVHRIAEVIQEALKNFDYEL